MIILDGKPLKDYGLYALKGHSHPSPNITNKTVKIPGKAGVYHFGNETGARPFNHPVGILEDSALATQNKIREFTKLLFDQYGKVRDIELKYDYEPDKYYTVVFDGSINPDRIFEYAEFRLPLVSNDPYAYAESTAYDETPIEYDTGEQYDNNIMYPNTEVVEWTNTRQYSGVHNHSYYAAPFSFMIEGSVINPRITNQATDKTTIIGVTLGTNERLYVDSERQQAWKVKITADEHYWLAPDFLMSDTKEWERMNLYGEVVGGFPQLVEGDNGFLFEGGNPDATIHFNWKHKFM